MALTRKMLKAMGIEDDKADEIIAAHAETVDALKKERDEAKGEAGRAEELEKRLEAMKAERGDEEGYAEKYEAEHRAFEEFKARAKAESEEREKRGMYRELLVKAGVDAKRIESVLRVSDLSKLTVKDGKLEDEEGAVEAIKRDWGDFIAKKTVEGAEVAKPPKDGGTAVTREQFAKMSLRERNQLYHDDHEAYEALVNAN